MLLGFAVVVRARVVGENSEAILDFLTLHATVLACLVSLI